MATRRNFLAAALFAGSALLSISTATAGEKFTPAAFAAAQGAGKPILVEITALWCPTCKAQKPLLSELIGNPKFKDLVTLEIDFDNQKEAMRSVFASQQSTLIVFKGKSEVGRSIGDTNKTSISALLDKSI